jgi:hypothetical protein
MCVKHVLWRKSLFNSKRAIYASILIISIFFLINVHLNFTIKYSVKDGNSTSIIDVITSSHTLVLWFKVSLKVFFLVSIIKFTYFYFFKFNFLVHFLIPFIFMNILIGYLFYEFKLNNYSQQNQRLRKNLRLKYRLLIFPAAVFFLTFFFTSIPINLISNLYLNIIIILKN